MQQRVRVAVQAADDLSMAGLTSYLRNRPEITVVAKGERVDVVLAAARTLSVDVAATLRQTAAPVVLVLDEIAELNVLTVAECRVVAVIPRVSATGDRVLQAVLAASAGGGVMPPNLVAELLEHVRRLRHELVTPGAKDLTAREVDILRLMADGFDTAEIATTLSYSERTVKNVIYGLTTRLHLRNRPHAVAYALRKGVI